jgi:hypothetical protein
MTKPFGPNRRHFIAIALRVGAFAAGLGLTSARAGAFGGTNIFKDRNQGDHSNCFLRGTHIATSRGDLPVEDIAQGDLLRTSRGDAVEVKWVGRQIVDLTKGATRPRAAIHPTKPVKIARFAIDDCTPHADLYVSPAHSLLLEGVLIPAGELINGISITQAEPDSGVAEYYNLLLGRHEVIFAEGAAV